MLVCVGMVACSWGPRLGHHPPSGALPWWTSARLQTQRLQQVLGSGHDAFC